MGEIKVKDKEAVVPGEILATGMDFLPSYGTYRINEEIRAARLGLVKIEGKVIKTISLSGRYLPKMGDTIIAKVTDVLMSGWLLDVNSAYHAMLGMKEATSRFIQKGADLTRIYALGDYVVCKIINVTSQKLVDVTMRGPGFRKLEGGRMVEVNTNKVPRIIGKEGSMITMIKNATGCKITVGQNGIVWVSGEPEMENLAIEAIRKAEEQSHIPGLTDQIKEFLEKNGAKVDLKAPNKAEERNRDNNGYNNEGNYKQNHGYSNEENNEQNNGHNEE